MNVSTVDKTEFNDWSELPLILTRGHMCRLLGCRDRTLRRKLLSGSVLPPLNEGEGNNRWLRDDVRRWIESGCPSSF